MSWMTGTDLMEHIIDAMLASVVSDAERAQAYEPLIEEWERRACDWLAGLVGRDVAFDVALHRRHPEWWNDEEDPECGVSIHGAVPELDHQKRIREVRAADARDVFAAGDSRVETGPVAFPHDWPGLFLRGDHCGDYALAVRKAAAAADGLEAMKLEALARLLESPRVKP